MNKIQYRLLANDEKRYLNESIEIISEFMTNNELDKLKYQKKLLSNISRFRMQSSHKRNIKMPSHDGIQSAGVCALSYYKIRVAEGIKRLTRFNLKNHIYKSNISVKDTITKSKLSKSLIILHETNHADTNQYNVETEDYIYSATYRLPIPGSNAVMELGPGMILAEVLNELYVQIQFFQRHPEIYENIKTIDELIYSPIIPSFKSNTSIAGKNYRTLFYIIKPLLIACDNDMGVSYESLKNDNKPFLLKQVNLNGNKVIKNDLLYIGRFASPEFEEIFDRRCRYEGAYVEVRECIDKMYLTLAKHNRILKKDVNKFLEICDLYKNAKYTEMEKKGYWNKLQRQYNEDRYEDYKKLLLKHMSMFNDISFEKKKAPIKTRRIKKTGDK